MIERNSTVSNPRSSGNDTRFKAAVAELTSIATQRGFYGTATLCLTVQDGFVQQARIGTERVIR